MSNLWFRALLLAIPMFALSACATGGAQSERDGLKTSLTGVLLKAPDAPEDCAFSLDLRSAEFDRISKVVNRWGRDRAYGIYARLGGSYLYSKYLLIAPSSGSGGGDHGLAAVAMVVDDAEFQRILHATVGQHHMSSAGPAGDAIHDECNVLYFRTPTEFGGRVFMASQVDGLDSIPRTDISSAFDAVSAHILRLEQSKRTEGANPAP
jgi:hypothetical protein